MLKVIADNPEKYPLDMIVNFDLEIEWHILHGLLSWFYIAYHIAEHAAKVLQ